MRLPSKSVSPTFTVTTLPALKLWPVGTVIAAVLLEIRRDDTAAEGAVYVTLAEPPLTAVDATLGCAV